MTETTYQTTGTKRLAKAMATAEDIHDILDALRATLADHIDNQLANESLHIELGQPKSARMAAARAGALHDLMYAVGVAQAAYAKRSCEIRKAAAETAAL